MKKIILASLLLSMIIFFSCKEKATNPPDTPLPEGYQQDVPWPSLADSPWPMTFGDPQWTKRSKGVGARLGIVEEISLPYANQTGIAIGPDSTIYYSAGISQYNDSTGLVAVGFDGKVKWIYKGYNPSNADPGSPIIGNDGTIYTTSPQEQKILAIKKDGTLKWEINNAYYYSYMNIGKDKVIYFYNGQKLAAISENGILKWEVENSGYRDAFTISPDSKFAYFNNATGVAAFNLETKVIEWKNSDIIPYYGTMLIEASGFIYCLSSSSDEQYTSLLKLNHDGIVQWENVIGLHHNKPYAMSLNKNGDCVVGLNDTLYSINTKGIISWKKCVGNFFNGEISTDVNGNIYFAVSESYRSTTIEFNAANKNGDALWKTTNSDFNNLYGLISPLVPAYNSTFVIGYRNNKILKIK